MGVAKTMNAIGEYDFYSSDFNQFIEKLGNLFKVNIHAGFIDNIYVNGITPKAIEDKYFNFNFSESYNLHVGIFAFHEKKSFTGNKYCQYELIIPVQLENEKELTLTFYPNGIFQLDFLPFSNHWQFFVEDIIGITDNYYNSHEEIVSATLKIRECYIEILKKIKCTEVIIWTDAYYKAENELIFNQRFNKKYNFEDVKNLMQKLDGINLVPLMDALNQEIKISSKREWYLDIAFVDKF